MEALRWLSLVALTIWVGGLVVLGAVVAPELFRLLEAGGGGRELAGRLFGGLLHAFQYVAWGCAAVLLVSLGLRSAIGPRPRRTALRFWTIAAMLSASLALAFYVGPRIEAVRATTSGSIAALAVTDPIRVTFGRLHGASTALMLLTAVAGLGLIWAEMKDRH